MNAEQIQETIETYKKLLTLAKDKAKLLEKLDGEKYCNEQGIKSIHIGMDEVYVNCDYYCRGETERSSFTFPTSWLSRTDEELGGIVEVEKRQREEEARMEEKKQELREKMEKEQLELEQYQKLKAKFEK